MTVLDICHREFHKSVTSLSPKRIAIAMQRLGYEQRRVLNTRGWNVVILTGDQIKEQQRMDAHRSVEE